jgi:uncharacterized protein (TIGR03435 family)
MRLQPRSPLEADKIDVMRLALKVLLVTLNPLIQAQSPSGPQPEFEVASIRPSDSGARGGYTLIPPGGERYTASNVYLKFLIQDAYRLQRDQITGGPGWISTDRYNLNAKAEKPASLETMRLMLQSLLVDRFRLRFHFETVEGPVYALTVDTGGPKLTRHDAESSHEPFDWANQPPAQQLKIAWHATAASMDYLAWQIASVNNIPVINSTGLDGDYDFDLTFTMPLPLGVPEGTLINGVPIDTAGPTVYEAVRKLGLKLERQRGPVKYMRIDSVERPSEN